MIVNLFPVFVSGVEEVEVLSAGGNLRLEVLKESIHLERSESSHQYITGLVVVETWGLHALVGCDLVFVLGLGRVFENAHWGLEQRVSFLLH